MLKQSKILGNSNVWGLRNGFILKWSKIWGKIKVRFKVRITVSC